MPRRRPSPTRRPLVAPPPVLDGLTPRDAPLVLSLSSHDGSKGVDVLIDALARARVAGIPLRACLLGGGRLLGAHRARIEALGLARSVVAPGWVADQKPYLAAADILAQPARAEQSGSVAVIEALQHKVAVVASAVDGLVEDLEDGRNALLAEPGDPRGLADALIRLAGNSELRRRLAARGRETFERRFSAAAFTDAVGAVYSEHGLEPET